MCLLVVLVDTNFAYTLVKRALVLAKEEALVVSEYRKIKNAIDHRVNSVKYQYHIIVGVSIFCFFGFAINIYNATTAFALQQGGGSYKLFGRIYSVMTPFLYFGRPMLFTLIVFFHSAIVNEKGDKLTTFLGTSSWSKTDNMKRLETYAYSNAAPLSFPLFTARLTKWDVFLRVVAFVAATLWTYFSNISKTA
jgi:hypothetical protein